MRKDKYLQKYESIELLNIRTLIFKIVDFIIYVLLEGLNDMKINIMTIF